MAFALLPGQEFKVKRLSRVCLLGAGLALCGCGGKTDRAVINNRGSDTLVQVAQHQQQPGDSGHD